MGRDLNWDYFNYHDYAAHLKNGSRLSVDYFPAGYQGYLNPLPYFLFGFMVDQGWLSPIISAVLAVGHSVNVLMLYMISRKLIGPRGAQGFAFAVGVTLSGAASPVFLAQMGSTFVDPLTTPLVMLAVLLLVNNSGFYSIVCAFALAGASVALKLTNVVYVAALIAALIVLIPGGRAKIFALVVASSSAAVGFLIFYGYWGWLLFREFGSPVFPLFNSLFQSPEFSSEAISFNRFVPADFWSALFRPFSMIFSESWIYTETVAPEIKPALLLLTLIVIFALKLAAPVFSAGVGAVRERLDVGRRECFLFVFVLVAWSLWLFTSGNGRYGVPLFLLIPLLCFVLWRAFMPNRYIALILSVVVTVQVVIVILSGNPRWNPMQWSEEWFGAELPEELEQGARLIVSVGMSSESYLVRGMGEGAAFTNPIGLISIPSEGPASDKLQRLLTRYPEDTYVIFRVEGDPGSDIEKATFDRYSNLVDRIGLSLEGGSCGVARFNQSEVLTFWANEFLPKPPVRMVAYCKARMSDSSESLRSDRSRATEILEAYESKCPGVFSPRFVETEGHGLVWSRLYGKHDLVLAVNFSSDDIYYYMARQAVDTLIGSVSTWEADVKTFRCGLPQRGDRGVRVLERHED